MRVALAKDLDLIKPNTINLSWIVDFPMFEWDAEAKKNLMLCITHLLALKMDGKS